MAKRSRFDWQRSHVIVTGGSQGIGAAVARAARARGAAVSVIARGEEQLRATAEPIGAAWACADVTDPTAMQRAVDQLEARSGPCDALVACAGTALPGRFLEVPIDEFESQMRLNYLGAVHAARAVLPGMVSRGRGHLVLTSSTAGVIGVVGYTGYGPSKAAVHELAHCLRYEVEPAGVTVAVLYPPDTDTPGFAAENTRKPPETAAVSGAITPVSADVVAAAVIAGIDKGRHHIAIDLLTRVLVRAGGIVEPIVRPILVRTIRRARESG
ncbi:NADH(P)-binding family protein [Rhodococcus sp. MTM3W5.2]|uniref:SDR family NAD(P)-dependent oxidoreductase n=1 Tax=Rhodococcus sp. MTM3W5.2 TaxID=1805827 RepID=UPI0009795C48|nr:SDR family NAD(P)-dependent oxidoreductase [Rhodococcus sp. MTM3W5.2]AQA25731.1 NADH(P)-binding family protein [Rhodococcus sp. MTM3W5.2]